MSDIGENRERMQARHEREIEELQANCPHGKTEWMPYMWAPGHFGGDVRVCKWCGKIVEEKEREDIPAITISTSHCPDCGRQLQLKGTGCACDEVPEEDE